MSGVASPYDAGEFEPPRARPRRTRGRLMARAAAWQPVPLTPDDLPQRRTDHGPFVDARGKPLRLAADPIGLAIVGGGADFHWAEVTRFVCRAYASRRAGHGMRYQVMTGRAAICWDMPHDADAVMRQEHERLCQLIVSRTGLLLIEEGVVAPTWPVEVRDGRSTPVPAVKDGTRRRVSPPPMKRRGRRSVWRWLGTLLLVLVLATAASYGTAMLLAHLSSQTAPPSALASTLHAGTTTYYDALTLNDGDWPVGVLPGSGATAAFGGHAYTLTAGSQPAAALAPGALGANALQVTVAGPQGAGAAGLALRASANGSAMLVFAVLSNGRWTLASADAANAASPRLHALGGGATGVIHRGAAASNTLLLIPQGSGYLCYVNGHYVGSVALPRATAADLPATGGAGVWVAAGTSATFTAFAVYPRP